MKTTLLSQLAGLLLLCLSCSAPKDNIFKAKDFGDRWPFTTTEVEVFCNGYNQVYCTSKEGKTYALNGKAMGAAETGKSEVTSLTFREIWKDNPEIEGTKIRVPSEIIQKGLSMCENNQ